MVKRVLVILVLVAGVQAVLGSVALSAGTNILEGRQAAIQQALGE